MIIIKLRDSNAFHHKCGDIILTKSTGKASKINIAAQTVRTFKKSNYTHAILCLNSATFAEAMYRYDLRTFFYTDKDRKSLDSENFKVIRYKNLKREHYPLLTKSVFFHLGKGYSLFNGPTETFCSSFIALVYNSAFPKLNLFKNPNNVYPVTLERLLIDDEDNWKDVTEEYIKELPTAMQNKNIYMYDNTEQMNFTIEHTRDTVSKLETLDEYMALTKEIVPSETSIPQSLSKEDKGEDDNDDKPYNFLIEEYEKNKD
ncbi:hypothetical protein [Priestia aryabhattai]|uniref:hypothetical protein n=1 Tax=Priestia aryabhattai TaxID=412384 RepID=UPI002E1BB49D|nr:hypothetical protein [Priestia aryabhattai]